MADSDETRKELLEELRSVRRRLEKLEKERAAGEGSGPPAGPTRRDVLRAAWVSPIILSLGLPRAGYAIPTTPTAAPTTRQPTVRPTSSPTQSPTASPTRQPTVGPTSSPTASPPTGGPTVAPTTPPQVPVVPLLNPDR